MFQLADECLSLCEVAFEWRVNLVRI